MLLVQLYYLTFTDVFLFLSRFYVLTFFYISLNVFTTLHWMQRGLVTRKLSVRPSVRPSVCLHKKVMNTRNRSQRQTDRQTDRRRTDKQTDGQTDRERERERPWRVSVCWRDVRVEERPPVVCCTAWRRAVPSESCDLQCRRCYIAPAASRPQTYDRT